MGLFTNNKKLCPICGNPTPRLLATKIEDTPICNDCYEKIDLPEGAIDRMSMNDFRKYMAYYEENQLLRDKYTETCSNSFGFFGGDLSLDTNNRLFRMSCLTTGFVMEASNLKKFRILEGSKLMFEGTKDALKVYDTKMEERVNALQPQITQYLVQKREVEFMERMERNLEKQDRDKDGIPDYRSNGVYTMTCDVPVPFQKFHVELTLEHPYWKSRSWEMDAPYFDRDYPSIDSYLDDYKQKSEELHVLALNLMQILNPDAKEITDADA